MKTTDFQRELAARYEEPMPLEDYERWRNHPVSEEEVRELMDLVRWFRGRYPSLKERFAYIRRKHAEWRRPLTTGR